MASDGKIICSMIIILVAVGFLVWGLQDLLKAKSPTEATTTDVISRQIKGFGFIVLSTAILSFGGILCGVMNGGGLGSLSSAISKS